jgi:hypothetical protein
VSGGNGTALAAGGDGAAVPEGCPGQMLLVRRCLTKEMNVVLNNVTRPMINMPKIIADHTKCFVR